MIFVFDEFHLQKKNVRMDDNTHLRRLVNLKQILSSERIKHDKTDGMNGMKNLTSQCSGLDFDRMESSYVHSNHPR